MYLNPLSVNNFNFGSRSNVSSASTPIQMRAPLMKDTVSFGNSNNEARDNVIKVVKNIFRQLESSKSKDVSEAAKAQFSNMAGGIFAKLGKNMENIKNANLATNYDPDVMMKDGAGVHLYKTLGGYIFDHVSADDIRLLNSIEVGYDKSVTISSVIQGEKKITKTAKGILGEKPLVREVEFR